MPVQVDSVPDWLRDLHWLLLSEPLLSTVPGALPAVVQQFDAAQRELIEAWLRDLAQRPDLWPSALTHLHAPGSPLRLGRYAERLLHYFLEAGPTHRSVASHIPLRRAHTRGGVLTVGEIDFLVEDAQGQRWHWELAVKFFICTAQAPALISPSDYVGPQGQDSLARKLHKIFEQQLRCEPPPPWDVPGGWQPAAFVRGRLFYPLGFKAQSWPVQLNPNHLRAQWVTLDHLDRLSPGPWALLPRSRWMSTCPADQATWSGAALRAALNAHWAQQGPRPTQVVCHRDGVETQRVMVLPPGR